MASSFLASGADPDAPTNAPQLSLFLLAWALPFSDFLQSGVYAFNAAPIMGDLGASPEEYSLVSTLYAITAIGVIFNHRWLVEQMGWRHLLRASALLFAAGALVCASSQTLGAFAFGRFVTALGCASFFTAGRVLVNLIPPSPKRFTGVKFFAAGIAWGGVCGPLLASLSLTLQDWRLAFAAQVVPAALILLLGEAALPNRSRLQPSPFDVGGLVALLGGSGMVLFCFQRSTFDFFSDRHPLYTYLALGLGALALSLWLVLRSSSPALRLQELASRRYLMGLLVFAVCYCLLGANNTALPMLLMRGLNLPLEVIGRLIALGALGGVAVWIAISRVMPRRQGPTRYYVIGFSLLATAGALLGRMSETAEPVRAVLPALLCTSAFVISVLSTTAFQAFRDLQGDEALFSHANQVKNVLAQLGIAGGMCGATLFTQWRTTVHYVALGESLSPQSLALQDALRRLTQQFGISVDTDTAAHMATATVNGLLVQQASFMASLDYFIVIAGVAGFCVLAVLMEWALRYLCQPPIAK